VKALVELSDGSFVSCSSDKTAKRWLSSHSNNVLQLLGIYKGHTLNISCAMEKDDNTLLTGSFDETIKVWNKTSCECLLTLQMGSLVSCLMKTKDQTRFVCGLYDGRVEVRRMCDLEVISSINIKHDVLSTCELEDGTFVSAADTMLRRWDVTGTVLQTFSGHSHYINRVVELMRDLIVSASDDFTIRMWKVSTGECLRRLTHTYWVRGLEKVRDRMFVSGSGDGKIVVWDENGSRIETYRTSSDVTAMTRLRDGSLIIADKNFIEIRRL